MAKTLSQTQMPQINTEEAMQLVVKAMAAAEVDPNNLFALGFMGPMGSAKSAIPIQAGASKPGWKVVRFFGSQMEAVDLTGNPYIVEGKTMYAEPSWWPTNGDKTIVVLEEINRAALDVQQAVMQMLNEQAIGVHRLPPSTVICICINPPNDIYQVSDLDGAFVTRAAWFEFVPSAALLIKYAYEHNWHDNVIKMLGLKPEMVSLPVAGEPCPNSRSWENVSKAHAIYEGPLLDKVVAGLIGVKAAVTFRTMTAKGFKVPVRSIEVFDKYPEVKERLIAQSMEENCYTLTDILGQIGVISKTKEHMTNLLNYVKDSPTEWQAKLIWDLPVTVLTKLMTLDTALAAKIVEIRGKVDTLVAQTSI